MLQYDSTADESDTAEAHGVGSSIQIAKNLLAIRASQALSRLSGLCSDDIGTPYNEFAADSIQKLLTPKLASFLKDQMPKDLLSRLNSNLESPEVTNTLELPLKNKSVIATAICVLNALPIMVAGIIPKKGYISKNALVGNNIYFSKQ